MTDDQEQFAVAASQLAISAHRRLAWVVILLWVIVALLVAIAWKL